MQTLQRVLKLIADQLQQLTPQTKLLLGSMMVILVMGLFIVSVYTGRTTMVALPISRNLAEDARLDAIRFLENRQIKWTERGTDIYVPVEDRHIILAELTDREIISGDEIDFDALISQDSPFISKTQNRQRWLRATMVHLNRMIGGLRGVAGAEVIIAEPGGRGGLGRASVAPSATVAVRMGTGTLGQDQVDAIAGMVAGSIAELKVQDVRVTDLAAGRPMYASSPKDIRSGKHIELQQEIESRYSEKILAALGYIQNVRVSVNAIVQSRETFERRSSVDEPKTGVTREVSRTLDSRNQAPGREPGARANVGDRVGGGEKVSSVTDETTDNRMIPAFGGTTSESQDHGGYATKVNASVGIPRSYFVELFRGSDVADPPVEPTQADLDPIIATESAAIEQMVTPLIDTGPNGEPGRVTVSLVNDHIITAGGSIVGSPTDGVAGGGGGGLGVGTDSLVKYVSLGGLALISMLMMFMMVRKASAQPDLPSAEDLIGIPPVLDGADHALVGEADVVDVPMEGVEVDEDSLRRARMLEQINEMATNAPEEAAKILKRWTRVEQ